MFGLGRSAHRHGRGLPQEALLTQSNLWDVVTIVELKEHYGLFLSS